jgi:DNA-binding NarL/FixJ family response regulator
VIGPNDLSALLTATMRESTAPPPEYGTLTEKEREIVREIATGRSNAEIAADLFLSESTIKTHVGSILRKLDLRDRVQVVVFAYEHGLTPPRES